MNNGDMFLCCFKGKTVCVCLEKEKEEKKGEETPTKQPTPLEHSVKTAVEGKFRNFQSSVHCCGGTI
jgi:hypothetical protein